MPTKKTKEQRDEERQVALDKFARDTAYKFGEAMATTIGFRTLDDAVEKEIRAFIRTKEFKRLVADDIRKTLSSPDFQEIWVTDLFDILRDALPRLASDISVHAAIRGRVQGRFH